MSEISNRVLLSKQLKLPITDIDKLIDNRQLIMTAERASYTGNSRFYQESKFLILSHIKDEEERDADTDWDDMVYDLKREGFDAFDNVLDVGCGIGSAGFNLQSRMPVNHLYCFEPNIISSKFIKKRTDKADKTEITINSRFAFAMDISGIRTAVKYDLIIAWGMFEHLTDKVAADTFTAMVSLLQPYGKIFLKNFYSDTEDYRLHFGKGEKITELFNKFADKIIYARHSDI